jgi:hypothetical protein
MNRQYIKYTMKLIFVLLIQVVVMVNLHSQNLIASYSDYHDVKHKFEYTYDDQNRLIEQVFSIYYKKEKINNLRSKIAWVYENDQFVKEKRCEFDFETSDWVLRFEFENSYDGNECMISQMHKFYSDTGLVREYPISIVNEFDCSDKWKQNDTQYSLFPRITRKRIGPTEIEIYEDYDSLSGEWIQVDTVERTYNQKNNITRHFWTLGFYTYATQHLYFYDDSGEVLTRYEQYFKNEPGDEWDLWSERDYVYEYEDSLLQKTILNNDRVTFYEYYCDGLLKKNTLIDEEQDSIIRIVTYEYDQKINCPETCEQLENLDISIYPNPVQDIVYLESDIFQKETSILSIYDVSGRLVYQQEINDRVPGIQVSMGSLLTTNGLFVVQLTSADGYSISKTGFFQK